MLQLQVLLTWMFTGWKYKSRWELLLLRLFVKQFKTVRDLEKIVGLCSNAKAFNIFRCAHSFMIPYPFKNCVCDWANPLPFIPNNCLNTCCISVIRISFNTFSQKKSIAALSTYLVYIKSQPIVTSWQILVILFQIYMHCCKYTVSHLPGHHSVFSFVVMLWKFCIFLN